MEVTHNVKLTKYERKTLIVKYLVIMAVLIIIGTTYYFSAQPASVSKLQSGRILNIFVALGLENITMHFIRKLAHFMLFSILGMAFTLFFSFRFTSIKLFVSSYFASIAIAIFDEIHQSFVPGRGPQVKDVMLDATGALGGIMIMTIFILIYRKYESKI